MNYIQVIGYIIIAVEFQGPKSYPYNNNIMYTLAIEFSVYYI